jgi:thiamine monophosphate synthase
MTMPNWNRAGREAGLYRSRPGLSDHPQANEMGTARAGTPREWKARIGGLPLVAIGGLNIERIEGVFAHGADAAAVVTDITLNADPEKRTREWLAATSAWRTAQAGC